MTATNQAAERLDSEIQEHREALRRFLASAESLAAEAWNAQPRPEQWTPAQIAEHLRLSYHVVRSELSGQTGFRVRSSRWQQLLFRLLYLPRILKSGRFPKGVPAVREIRPENGPFDRKELLDALRTEGEQLIALIQAIPFGQGASITHPFLGKLGLLDGVRLATQHIRHHQKQLVGTGVASA